MLKLVRKRMKNLNSVYSMSSVFSVHKNSEMRSKTLYITLYSTIFDLRNKASNARYCHMFSVYPYSH